MDAAIQLHRDVCLMATNLDVRDQYALCLHGMASKLLKLGLASSDFPSAEVTAGQSPPRFCKDGGHGSVATLIGSDHAGLRHVVMYDQTFRGRSLHCSGIIMDYGLS